MESDDESDAPFQVDPTDDRTELEQYKSYLKELEYRDEDTDSEFTQEPTAEDLREMEEFDLEDLDAMPTCRIEDNDRFGYAVEDVVSEQTTGISAAHLAAPLPGFQPGDRAQFGRDSFLSAPIGTNSVQGALTTLHEMAMSIVPPRGQDQQTDMQVFQTLWPLRPSYYKRCLIKWREGTLKFKHLLGDHIYVEGPFHRDTETGLWTCHFC